MDKRLIMGLRRRLEREGTRVVVVPHISPDGDAVGACSALWQLLDKVGVECQMVTCDFVPEYLRWMKRVGDYVTYQRQPGRCRYLLREADVLVMLDHNTRGREGDLEPWTREFRGKIVMIDHHPDPEEASYVVSEPGLSSTCEVLYNVIAEGWGREVIDGDMANSLYAGISTDTGGLSHNSSLPGTYRVIAELLELGLDKGYVHEQLYQRNSEWRLRLMGNCVLNKMELVEGYPLAIIPVTLEELERYHYRDGDLEGVVNLPLTVEGVAVSVQVTERKDRVKLSFRSKGEVPVNMWAREFFNGGGHPNAAGGQSTDSFEAVVARVRETAGWFFGEVLRRKFND